MDKNLIHLKLKEKCNLNKSLFSLDIIKQHYQEFINVSDIKEITFSFYNDEAIVTLSLLKDIYIDQYNDIPLQKMSNSRSLKNKKKKISKTAPQLNKNQDEYQIQDNQFHHDEDQNQDKQSHHYEHQNQDKESHHYEHQNQDSQDELLIQDSQNEDQYQENQWHQDEDHCNQSDQDEDQSQDFKYPQTPNKESYDISELTEDFKLFDLKKELKTCGFSQLKKSPNKTSGIKISIDSAFNLDVPTIEQIIKKWKENGFDSNFDKQIKNPPSEFSNGLERVKTWVCGMDHKGLGDTIPKSDIIILLLNPKSKEHLAKDSEGNICPTFESLSNSFNFKFEHLCITDIYPYYCKDYSIPDVSKCKVDMAEQVERVITNAKIIILGGADCCLGFTQSLNHLNIKYDDISKVLGFPSFLVHKTNTLVLTVHHPSLFNIPDFKKHCNLVISISKLILNSNKSELQDELTNNYRFYFENEINQDKIKDEIQDENQINKLNEIQDNIKDENQINNQNEIQNINANNLRQVYQNMSIDDVKSAFKDSKIKTSQFINGYPRDGYEKSSVYDFFKGKGSPKMKEKIAASLKNYMIGINYDPNLKNKK